VRAVQPEPRAAREARARPANAVQDRRFRPRVSTVPPEPRVQTVAKAQVYPAVQEPDP